MNNEHLYKIVGLLRSSWFDKNNKLVLFSYGTAFAISNQILITCSHNVYSDKINSYASEVIFFPNLAQEVITARTQRYRSHRGEFCRSLVPQTLMNKQPIKEELALVLLEDPIETNYFLKIGCIQEDQIANEMKVVGYPSQNYMTSQSIFNIEVKRHQCVGQLYQNSIPTTHILSYTMSTFVGVSGSPILIKDQYGYYKIVGVHTHRGLEKGYNSGLYFDKQTIKNIEQWTKQLQQEFKKRNSLIIERYFTIKQCAFGLTLDTSQMFQLNEEQKYEQAKRFQNQKISTNNQIHYDVEEDMQGDDEDYQNKSAMEGDYDLFEEDFYAQSSQINPKTESIKNFIVTIHKISKVKQNSMQKTQFLSMFFRSFHYKITSMIFYFIRHQYLPQQNINILLFPSKLSFHKLSN